MICKACGEENHDQTDRVWRCDYCSVRNVAPAGRAGHTAALTPSTPTRRGERHRHRLGEALPPQFNWTPERFDQVVALHGEGLSAARIAVELNSVLAPGETPVTRNAILGKLHRNRREVSARIAAATEDDDLPPEKERPSTIDWGKLMITAGTKSRGGRWS